MDVYKTVQMERGDSINNDSREIEEENKKEEPIKQDRCIRIHKKERDA